VTQAIQVRNLREGEADTLPPTLLNHGMPYLDPQWCWVVESAPPDDPPDDPSPISILTAPHTPPPAPPPASFALVVCSFAHGWIVLWRILSLSPLPPEIPLNWIMEALPQVFAEAASRGCVGFLTLLADNRPEEVQLARIVAALPSATLLPFAGSMGVGRLDGLTGEDQ